MRVCLCDVQSRDSTRHHDPRSTSRVPPPANSHSTQEPDKHHTTWRTKDVSAPRWEVEVWPPNRPATKTAVSVSASLRLRLLISRRIHTCKIPVSSIRITLLTLLCSFRNHVGSFECRLCLTVHQNDGSYLAHTQGRKHQTNLARRAAREAKEGKNLDPITGLPQGMIGQQLVAPRKNLLKIGRPGYKITKIRDPVTRQLGLLFQLQYPEIGTEIKPRYRFMSAFEQRVEVPPDKSYQYLLVAAEPYVTVSFKLQAREVDRSPGKFWTYFDADNKEFFLQLFFKTEREERYAGVPGLAPRH
jgi:splicing factor 3A subunit 2